MDTWCGSEHISWGTCLVPHHELLCGQAWCGSGHIRGRKCPVPHHDSAFFVPRAASPACHAAFAHAPHFGTPRNSHPGTHRNAGPRALPTKQQVDELTKEPPHFGTPRNSHPGTHRNAGGPDVSENRRLVKWARSLCQPIRRFRHNVLCSVCPRQRFRGPKRRLQHNIPWAMPMKRGSGRHRGFFARPRSSLKPSVTPLAWDTCLCRRGAARSACHRALPGIP